MTTLWIRADASAAMGIGHVMRMMALAEAAERAGISPRYAIVHDPVVANLPRVGELGAVLLASPDDTAWLARVSAGDLVAFDGYHFPPELYTAARSTGARVAALDDFGCGAFDVDVLLNPSPGPAAAYDVPATTTLLLGPQYALIREEFREQRRHRADGAEQLLLTFGGSDPAGMLDRAVRLLDAHRTFPRVTGLVGPAAEVDPALRGSRPWLHLTAPPAMAPALDGASAVVSAAGSTTWELLCMGLPVAVVRVVDNQRHIGPTVAAAGAALFLGATEDFEQAAPEALARLANPSEQARLSTAALRLVDGEGAYRALAALSHPSLK